MTQAGTRSATPSAVPRFTRLEAVDPADVARDRGIDPMAYLPDMDVTDSPVLDELLARAAAFDFDAATEADVRAAYAQLRDIRDEAASRLGVEESDLPLSMGMSRDLEWAITEGATIVRLGTAIFGARRV